MGMATAVFKIPEYKAVNIFGKEVSISDHEPLHAEYVIIPNTEFTTFCSSNPSQNYGKNCEVQVEQTGQPRATNTKPNFFEVIDALSDGFKTGAFSSLGAVDENVGKVTTLAMNGIDLVKNIADAV